MDQSADSGHARRAPSESGDCQCGWEAQPQAFRWFPELGTVRVGLPPNNPLCRPADMGLSRPQALADVP